MDINYLLTSTRSVRKGLVLDAPVDPDELRDCLRIACQAANGSNQQSWRWLVIRDAKLRKEIARHYREIYVSMTSIAPGDGRFAGADDRTSRLFSSVDWLVAHLADVPVHIIPCYRPYTPGDQSDAFHLATYYGSIFPAVWNLQLALHSRGYGSCITTLHLNRQDEFRALLGIPEGYMQGCLLPVGRIPPGKVFKPAPRGSIEDVVALDRFDGPPLQRAS